MESGRPPSGDSPPPSAYPGEPGVGNDLRPPFVAKDPETRWLFGLNRFGIRPGLERINALLEALGHPEESVPTLVVAGTNGKGSTTLILDALLRQAGYRTASFTSPHLLRVHERLTIQGQPCATDLFAAKIRKLRPAVEEHQASWFEVLTALSLDICRDEKVEVLVCEAGLGGRLDATNALPALGVWLVTVSADHQRILGDDLEAITAEKLGLLKPGVPLFSSVAAPLRPQVFQAAVRAKSTCFFLDELVRFETEGDRWRWLGRERLYEGLPRLPTRGLQRNAALALLGLGELAQRGVLRPVTDPAEALAGLFLPGRFQRLLNAPDWILDTAHNSEALTGTLAAFCEGPCRGRRWVLFGCLRDKSLGAEVGQALGCCDNIVAAPIGLPRSRNPDELVELLEGWGLPPAAGRRVVGDLPAALRLLAGAVRPTDRVLVTGSCFLVAEVLHLLGYRDLRQTQSEVVAHQRLAAWRDSASGGSPA